MIKLENMLNCSFVDVLEAWNKGFKGYNFDMTTTISKFLQRLTNEDLSPEYSWVAFSNEKPIGLILNGIRSINGELVAWNGGTAVAPEFRGKGLGKQLVEKSLETYLKFNVNQCYLEAISNNTSAIRLYENLNYKTIDSLCFYKGNGLKKTFTPNYSLNIKETLPRIVGTLPFYQHGSSWQTQWQSVKNGQGLIAYENNQPVGYALYQLKLNEQNEQPEVLLYQCHSHTLHSNDFEIVNALLQFILEQESLPCNVTAINIPRSNEVLTKTLNDSGFEEIVEQVQMTQVLKPS